MTFQVLRPIADVIHLRAQSQDELARAFVRIQEFYESPIQGIRGCVFSVETFEALYAKSRGKDRCTYYEDWHAFNVPGRYVREFFRAYAGNLTPAEGAIARVEARNIDRFYLIGTYRNDDVDHELAHCLWALDERYRAHMERLLHIHDVCWTAEMGRLGQWLIAKGYEPAVVPDEMQAYLATNNIDDWRRDFGVADGTRLHEAAKHFRTVFYGSTDRWRSRA